MNQASGKPSIKQRKKARSILVQALYQWQITDYPASDIEAQYRVDTEERGGSADWDYFHEIFVGIVGNQETLDQKISPFLDRDLERLDPIELAILRLGCFEFSERIDIPYKVVINECVDLAKKFGASDSHKYINGVLDKMARELRKLEIGAK